MAESQNPHTLSELVKKAQGGQMDAYAALVRVDAGDGHAVASTVLRGRGQRRRRRSAAYLRAFRRLEDVKDPAAFAGLLRRS